MGELAFMNYLIEKVLAGMDIPSLLQLSEMRMEHGVRRDIIMVDTLLAVELQQMLNHFLGVLNGTQ